MFRLLRFDSPTALSSKALSGEIEQRAPSTPGPPGSRPAGEPRSSDSADIGKPRSSESAAFGAPRSSESESRGRDELRLSTGDGDVRHPKDPPVVKPPRGAMGSSLAPCKLTKIYFFPS